MESGKATQNNGADSMAQEDLHLFQSVMNVMSLLHREGNARSTNGNAYLSPSPSIHTQEPAWMNTTLLHMGTENGIEDEQGDYDDDEDDDDDEDEDEVEDDDDGDSYSDDMESEEDDSSGSGDIFYYYHETTPNHLINTQFDATSIMMPNNTKG
ncbi:hypothetical protein OQA88_2420 [Cercophora sp. LCS_1]